MNIDKLRDEILPFFEKLPDDACDMGTWLELATDGHTGRLIPEDFDWEDEDEPADE